MRIDCKNEAPHRRAMLSPASRAHTTKQDTRGGATSRECKHGRISRTPGEESRRTQASRTSHGDEGEASPQRIQARHVCVVLERVEQH